MFRTWGIPTSLPCDCRQMKTLFNRLGAVISALFGVALAVHQGRRRPTTAPDPTPAPMPGVLPRKDEPTSDYAEVLLRRMK